MGNLIEISCFFRCGVVFTMHPGASFCQAVRCDWTGYPIYKFATLTDGLQPVGNLAFDQAGNVYGTTESGGTGQCVNGCGIVFQLTRSGSGWTKTTLYNFQGGGAVSPASGVIIDPFGALYGTTVAGGQFNRGMIFQLKPSGSGWTFTPIYSFHNGLNGINDGGSPEGGLLMDAAGNLYGTTGVGGTGGGGTVFKMAPSGAGWTFTLIAASPACNGSVGSLAFDSAGNLYGTTRDDGAFHFSNVFKLSPAGGEWTYTDLYDFTGGDDGGEPFAGVTLDSSGNMYLADLAWAIQFNVALSASGSGAVHSAKSTGMAQPVLSSGDATGTEDRKGRDGPSTRGSSELDDAARIGVSAVEQVRFVRGAARTSPWCAVEHRDIEWAPRSSSRGVRTGNHDQSSDRRDAWVGPRFLT